MGQNLSKEDLRILEETSYYHFPFSKELKSNYWDTYNAKNWEYYSGKRFFKVSRKNYRDYTRGYIWGYYYKGKEIDIEF